jgi:two-component system, LytTR family, response regulator
MIRTAIIDDEIKSLLILKKLLMDHCPGIEVIIETTDISKGCTLIKEKRPELVFLDIEMPEGTGFDLLREFNSPFFHVIFVTAHSSYAVKAFKFSAVDYVVKPIDVDDLVSAVKKATDLIKKEMSTAGSALSFLNIRTRQGSFYIKPESILRIQAENSYSRIFINDGQHYVLSYHLGFIEERLDKNIFLRVHKSDIININYLKSFHNAGEFFAEMVDGSMVKVSRRSRKQLEDKLKQAGTG